ncbi:MetQ/NlpA family ABC transporter substrate-binding protein [Breznakia pachnodae]|uniref:Lipoprotein n=1 Tax=Breznakia pachnodae TaxID=265178 RepID=A0ABU0E5F1_9FIRM|nr:MetQ/NlpA family ABC transporter substrate-binding protein [Breznakia pachnodae]MDQ0361939.1 D-methionine transport system substrate-binding protein [Breznakia pachnodae]
MKKLFSLVLVCGLVLTGCGSSDDETAKDNDEKELEVIKVAASEVPHAEILNSLKDQLEEEGYKIEVTVFDDYILPNTTVDEGEYDANFFQHITYLNEFNASNGTDLTDVADIHFEPLGIYSNDTTEKNDDFSIDDVKEGAVIAVPDDATNEARALQLLAAKGIIELKEDAGINATTADITSNPKNIEIKEIVASGIPTALPDVDYAVINGNYALTFEVTDKVITTEATDSDMAEAYKNVLVVKVGNEDSDKTKALVKALTSKETKEFIEETYKGTVVPVFE